MESNLNGADIKILRRMIRYEFKKALFREIEVEKCARPGEDPPRDGTVAEKIDVNVLDWLGSYLPFIEGALRGMQQDVGKVNNKIFDQVTPGIAHIAKILISSEANIKFIAKLVNSKVKEIESNSEGRHNSPPFN